MPELLTAHEAAEYLRISVRTARRWLRDHDVPPVPMGDGGRCRRYRKTSIDRAIADAEAAARRANEPRRRRNGRVVPLRGRRSTRSAEDRIREITKRQATRQT